MFLFDKRRISAAVLQSSYNFSGLGTTLGSVLITPLLRHWLLTFGKCILQLLLVAE